MKAMIALLLLALAALCSGQASHVGADKKEAPPSWKAVIAPEGEPGDALVVSGTVYGGADGATPLEGASVYVYHTDARGFYGANDTSDSSNPRLRATMLTGKDGKYEFRTIKPGSYPSERVPAHVHYHVNAPGYRERVFEIVFDDDPFVDERVRERARSEESIFSIRKLERDGGAGAWRCVQDVKLKK